MKLIDIISKDLRVVLRDRTALIFIFLMPIVLITILSFALGGVFTSEGVSIGHLNIAVVDNTTEDEAQQTAQQMTGYGAPSADMNEMSLYAVLDSKEVSEFLSYTVMDEAAANEKLANAEIDAVVTIPKGFNAGMVNMMMGSGGDLQIDVVGAQNRTMESGIVASIVRAYTDTFCTLTADMDILIQTAMSSGGMIQETMSKLDFESFMQNLSQQSDIRINMEGVAARKALSSFSYYSIAITCMFLLYAAGQGSTFLLTESQEKTLLRLTAAGVSTKKLLLGKSVAVFFLCIIQLIVLLGFSTLAFGIDWGDPLAFVLISVCVAISITGLGVLLMVLVYRAGNPSVGSVFQSVIAQVLALFGGSFLPLAVLPAFFSTVALFTPNGLAVMAYTGNVTGAPLIEILPYLGGSVLLGIVLYFVGLLLFPKERRA
jgi:ABC-2 type transport system permease protein